MMEAVGVWGRGYKIALSYATRENDDELGRIVEGLAAIEMSGPYKLRVRITMTMNKISCQLM